MKKKLLMCGIVILILGICFYYVYSVFKNSELSDSKRFAQEYTSVTEDNVFVYRDVDSIIRIMEHGTGVVYLGYPECKWCQAYVKYLNEVAKEVGIDKIYYANTKKIKENSMDKYYELVDLLDGNLQYNDEGNQWIYVPNVSFHINGKVVGTNYESSKDTDGLDDPSLYWTSDRVSFLKSSLKKYMLKVKDASNICTDCNK